MSEQRQEGKRTAGIHRKGETTMKRLLIRARQRGSTSGRALWVLMCGIVLLAVACQGYVPRADYDRLQAELQAAQKQAEASQSFEAISANWQRMSKTGALKSSFDVKTVQSFTPVGPALVTPKPGNLLVYENTGTGGHGDRPAAERNANKSTRVVVIDARTKEVIASKELPEDLAGSVHTTGLSPDGRYVYITGPQLGAGAATPAAGVSTSSGIVKVDALTLEPLKVLDVGGRLHHAQVFGDKHILMDTFARAKDGLDVFLLDPATDQIVGGIRDEDLGGSTYTAFGDPKGEYIYVLMEPLGYTDSPVTTGYTAAGQFRTGNLRWIRPFWVAKIKADTWEVVAEYPYPAYRSDWVQLSADGKFMYVGGAGDDKVVKIDLATGKVVWSQATGAGPYGIELNANSSEIWVADKGETVSMYGRTITVIDDKTGRHKKTILSGYMIDHLILSPDGKEMWATSNGDGKIYVYDAATYALLAAIRMPGFGDAHGLVFVHHDATGKGRVVADQGDFHAGVDPRNGRALVSER
ncbi:MAG: PQQ-binding-like beta-propeller repeat protein [Chloroflexi bacterium]|nr:PQQ-binding-like beta-propeller repeat protein [Chloroflexota bacterium]